MHKLAMALAGLAITLAAASAGASPEDDRLKVVKYFAKKYPDVKIETYIHGALAYNPDAKAQYDGLMEFPSYVGEIEKGARMWKTPFRNGKTYADCLPNGGRMIAGNYPLFDDRKGRVVTFEMLLNECRVGNGEEPYGHDDMKTMGVLTAYARTLSDGMKMNIRVDGPAAQKAFEDGKKTYYGRAGQLNLACASCHVEGAGNNLRAETLSPVLGQATHWPVFRGGERLTTLQNRYATCLRQVRQVPDPEGGARMNNLEYFHSYLSNGMEMKASVFRK
jgi:sulfur-oxidizing protein SoxA